MKKTYEDAVTAMHYVISKNADFASRYLHDDDARHWAITAIYGVAEALERLGEIEDAFEFTSEIIDVVCAVSQKENRGLKNEKRER